VLGPITAFSLMNVIVKLSHLPALAFAFYRLWMGAFVMVTGLVVTGRRLSWALLRTAAPAGVLFGANIAFFFAALKATSVADVLIVAALQPALTLIVAGRLFGERVTSGDWLWTGISLAGVVVVIVGSSGSPAWSLRGDLFAVGSLLAWTVYWLVSKRVRQTLPAFEYMTAVTVTAALVVTPVALASGERFHVRWQDWLWLVLFVAGAQGGHTILAWSHEQIEVSVSSLLILIEPVVSSAVAFVVLGETLAPVAILGGIVAIGAIGVVIRRATRRPQGEAVPPEIAPA
jgi:drug/metabolite transporter (DMT)-like permease